MPPPPLTNPPSSTSPSISQTVTPGPRPGAPPKMPISAWRDDDVPSTNATTNKSISPGTTSSCTACDLPISPTQITSAFTNQHDLDPPIKLTITLDQSTARTHTSIYSLSELRAFSALKRIISSSPVWRQRPDRPASVHIDKFTIALTNALGERISSDIRPSETRKYRATGTEYSAETFDALMAGAVVARCRALAVDGRAYCLCGDCRDKEKVKCPEILVMLASLDLSNRRVYRGEAGGPVDPKKVVIVDYDAFGLLPPIDEGREDESNVVLDAVCVRNLLEDTRGTRRSHMLIGGREEEEFHAWDDAGTDDRYGTTRDEVRSKLDAPRFATHHSNDDDPRYRQPSTLTLLRSNAEIIEILDDDEDDTDFDIPWTNWDLPRRSGLAMERGA